MRKFSYLPHTADIAFVGYGPTLKKALENSATALLNVMLDLKSVSKVKAAEASVHINESADSKENLVWFTLQDILSKVDTIKLNALRFEVTRLSQGPKGLKLNGRLVYKKSKADNSLLSVKAITPHDLRVEKNDGVYAIHVVIDV